MTITYAVGVNSPTNLWQMVQDYTENTESSFVSYIPTFIQTAEERIYNTIQIPALRKTATGTLTLNNQYLTLPTDWLGTFSLQLIYPSGVGTFLLNKDAEYMREAFPDATVTGTPTHYGQFDQNTLVLGPTPDQNYTAQLSYYYYPASIVTAGTSWLGDNVQNVLLYGTLREAYLYLKGEEDLINYYEQKYQEGIALLKVLGEGKNRRDVYRSGQNRVPVT
jgi:hypothetical protein